MSRKRLRIFEKITKKQLKMSQQFSTPEQPHETVADLKRSFVSETSEVSLEDAVTPEPQAGFLCIKV